MFFVSFNIFSDIKSFSDNTKSCELLEFSLVIIKPDAVADNHIGDVLEDFEKKDLRVVGMKMTKLSKDQAEAFYKVHSKKPFYKKLVDFMSSGPIVAVALEGRQAISSVRKIVGDKDPLSASKNSTRSKYGSSIDKNAVHASDSKKNGIEEIEFFFHESELYSPCSKIVFEKAG